MTLRRSTFGLFLALLALTAQVAFGALAPRLQELQTIDIVGELCHGGDNGAGEEQPVSPHHSTDCLICPLCISVVVALVKLPAAPALPLARSGIIAAATAPPSGAADPLRRCVTPPSRGPPPFLD